MPCSESAGRVASDEEALVLWQIRERELIGIQKTSRDGASEPLCVPGVRLLCHRQVSPKRRFQRPQDVSTTAAGAQKKDIHMAPVYFRLTLNRNGTTTHPACV